MFVRREIENDLLLVNFCFSTFLLENPNIGFQVKFWTIFDYLIKIFDKQWFVA